jgi:hypothetical protein
VRVLWTAGVQYRTEGGYEALRQLVASTELSRADAARIPALATALGLGVAPHGTLTAGGGEAGTGHDAVTDAVVSLLADERTGRPTLVVVDDAQWLDRDAADVLARVARRLIGTKARMLVAARAGEESFFDHTGLPLHEVGPLGEAASEALLTRRFPVLAPQVRRRLMADAEGNPLALLELPTTLTGSQQTEQHNLPRRLPLTQRLQSAFASRVEGLPAPTRYLLLVAAYHAHPRPVGRERPHRHPGLRPRLRGGRPRSRIRTLPGAGHLPQLETPEQPANEITAFAGIHAAADRL